MSGRWSPFRRFGLAVLALAFIGLVLGAAALAARGPTRASAASPDANDKERCDAVGEGHPTGGVRASLVTQAFPGRLIALTVPAHSAATVPAVEVYEDCQLVRGVVATPLPTTSTVRRYSVRYASARPFGEREVELEIRIAGVGAFDIDYNAPKSPSAAAAAAGRGSSTGGSWSGLVVASLAAALLLAMGLTAFLAGALRRNDLRRRVGEFTSKMSEPTEAAGAHSDRSLTLLSGLERLLERMSWWARFKANVEIAQFPRSAAELVAIAASVTLGFALILGVTVAVWLPLLILPLAPLTLHLVVQRRLGRRRALFSDQLGPHLEELAAALRAGHGLVAGLTAMADAAAEPSKGEWARVIADEQLGMPLDTALRSLAARMDCREVEQVALVAALHSQTGGNMAEVLDRIAEGVRERAELRRELSALTSQARLSRWVVTALPPAIMAIVTLTNPSYMQPLVDTTTGRVMLAIAAVLLISGSLIMKALTRIEV
jgi:tight adherence protein B